MKNTTKDDATEKEFLSWCDSVGIKFTPAQLETLRRCHSYAERLIDRGANTWPQGFPLIRTPTTNPAPKNVIDTKQIYAARRNINRSVKPRRTN